MRFAKVILVAALFGLALQTGCGGGGNKEATRPEKFAPGVEGQAFVGVGEDEPVDENRQKK